jgi:hypothetical protein
MMATAVITFTSVFLGTGTTARGRFGAQLAVSTTSLVVVAASLGPLVLRFGLNGAACSLLLGSIVELGAYTVLTLLQAGPAHAELVLAGGVQRDGRERCESCIFGRSSAAAPRCVLWARRILPS